MDTKACSLTEDEVGALIKVYANELIRANIDNSLERMNYLNRRLKAFKEDAPKIEEPKTQMTDTQTDAINAAAAANPIKDGW